MRIELTWLVLGLTALMLVMSLHARAQAPPPPPSMEQLDQMLAPIALYPDPLLAQILTAATYPLEIVKADRWLKNPGNAALSGDALAAALVQQPWDPSVKSLVPFPQVLQMMDDNLTWTEALGDAFLASQSAVMDSIQRLRQEAQAAGRLESTPQEIVATQGPMITIEPPGPEIVYVPVYDPSMAFGVWPYPEYPPYYFPGFFDGAAIGDLGLGWFGFGINVPLWGWGHWDWGHHRIDIDGGRYNTINAHHPPLASGAWRHDPIHRGGVPYRDAATRSRFQGTSATVDARRNYRGFPAAPVRQSGHAVEIIRGTAFQTNRQTQSYRVPSPPPAFESFGRGEDVRAQATRGYASRQLLPAMTERGGGGRMQSAPASAGRGRR